MKVTFHKAIDAVNNFMSSLKTLSTMENIDSVLTSGTKENALSGKEYIKLASRIFWIIKYHCSRFYNQSKSKGNSLRVKNERISWQKDCWRFDYMKLKKVHQDISALFICVFVHGKTKFTDEELP